MKPLSPFPNSLQITPIFSHSHKYFLLYFKNKTPSGLAYNTKQFRMALRLCASLYSHRIKSVQFVGSQQVTMARCSIIVMIVAVIVLS